MIQTSFRQASEYLWKHPRHLVAGTYVTFPPDLRLAHEDHNLGPDAQIQQVIDAVVKALTDPLIRGAKL